MSPERVRGLSQVDAQSDIYSLGAVLYELVTGRKPFDGESAYSIMVEQVEKQPAPPIEVEPGLPEPLNDIILGALEKDPSRRFSSADEFRQALMQLGEHASTPAPFVLRWRRAGARYCNCGGESDPGWLAACASDGTGKGGGACADRADCARPASGEQSAAATREPGCRATPSAAANINRKGRLCSCRERTSGLSSSGYQRSSR
jgi:serine/threonine protein kinase